MASESEIEALLAESEDVIESIRKFSDQPIPNTLAEAVEKGIDLSISAASAAILIHYSNEDRAADRKRVVRLDVALSLMQQMEEEFLNDLVKGGIKTVWGLLVGFPGIVLSCLHTIFASFLLLDWDAVELAIRRSWRFLLRHLYEVVGVAELAVPLQRVLALRARYDAKLRHSALKQRTNVKRVWRRKRTRG